MILLSFLVNIPIAKFRSIISIAKCFTNAFYQQRCYGKSLCDSNDSHYYATHDM